MRFEELHGKPDSVLQAHADPLRPWVHEAGNPFTDWYFGDEHTASTLLASWLLRASSELYLGHALLLLDDAGGGSRPIGCVIGMAGDRLAACRAADFAALCEALQSHPEADEIAAQTIEVSRELFPEVPRDTFYISRVAVGPERRGQGLGRRLLARAIDAQRARGFSRFRLDVSADNTAAIRMYESLGLRVTGTARSRDADLAYCAMELTA